MTKQTYPLLAKALARNNAKMKLIEDVCAVLKQDNPLFNPDKFLSAILEEQERNDHA